MLTPFSFENNAGADNPTGFEMPGAAARLTGNDEERIFLFSVVFW